MKLKANQLENHLQRQGFAPTYLLTGDEPLQMMECADTLRYFARRQGFTERVVLTVETGFDWSCLDQYANSLSLFANKRLLEIRLNKSPGNDGTKALTEYVNNLPADTILFITAGKLDASKQKAKWFTTLDQSGVIIQVFPIEISLLPGWIAQRLKFYGLQASSETINLIAERSEGHLLSTAQEIEKLRLLYGSGHIETAQVLEAVADSARFEVFNWMDTVLAGDRQHCIRQFRGLQTEGVEPILVAWVLNREIRNLGQITYALKNGQRLEQVFKTYRVWQNRKNVVNSAIKRHPQPRVWQKFLQEMVKIDNIIKGQDNGNPWDELQRLSLLIAGVNLLGKLRHDRF